jgi:steroid 5-alpha reductase family enzyme
VEGKVDEARRWASNLHSGTAVPTNPLSSRSGRAQVPGIHSVPEPNNMGPVYTLVGLNLCIVALLMCLVWGISFRIKDVSIVDIAWGAMGAIVAAVTFLLAEGAFPRRLLLTGMVGIWGIRLAIHIGFRKRGKGEDFRYAAMRKEQGEAFPVRSLFTIFLFQALLIWAITLPVQVAQLSPEPAALTGLDLLGLSIWLLGFGLEAVADYQLSLFLSNPANAGRVMDEGLWRYSRHPNYFGESLMWWGVFLVAAVTEGGWMGIFSPLLMTYFLLRISGVPILEKGLVERRKGYQEYVERTSLFIPWPPRKG